MKRGLALAVLLGCPLPVKVGEVSETSTTIDTIDTGDPTTSGPGPSESSSSETGDPPPAVRHDYAMRFADLPDPDPTGSSTTAGSGGSGADGSTGGDPFDPDSLVITASIGIDTCDDPYAGPPCGERWSATFNLPPELQLVGATGRLEDHNAFVVESGPLNPDDDCFGGGGTLLGTFEITAIDAEHVAGHLAEVELAPFGTELDFDAPRC